MENKKTIKVLMVDDHQTSREGHKLILENAGLDYDFNFDEANNCDLAWEKITTWNPDLVFLDMSFPVRPNSKFPSGEELGKKIKEDSTQTKIIVLTGNEDGAYLMDVFSTIGPEGFLLKSGTNTKEIALCVETVLEGGTYQSPKISKLVHSRIANRYGLDEQDRNILRQLSQGVKTKDLPKHVFLSLRSVEARKQKLKEIFDAEDNESLLKKAREAGYL